MAPLPRVLSKKRNFDDPSALNSSICESLISPVVFPSMRQYCVKERTYRENHRLLHNLMIAITLFKDSPDAQWTGSNPPKCQEHGSSDRKSKLEIPSLSTFLVICAKASSFRCFPKGEVHQSLKREKWLCEREVRRNGYIAIIHTRHSFEHLFVGLTGRARFGTIK